MRRTKEEVRARSVFVMRRSCGLDTILASLLLGSKWAEGEEIPKADALSPEPRVPLGGGGPRGEHRRHPRRQPRRLRLRRARPCSHPPLLPSCSPSSTSTQAIECCDRVGIISVSGERPGGSSVGARFEKKHSNLSSQEPLEEAGITFTKLIMAQRLGFRFQHR